MRIGKTQRFPLEWKIDRAGYYFSGNSEKTELVRRGGALKTYQPADIEPAAHFIFADLEKQVVGVQAVAKLGVQSAELPFWQRKFIDREAALLAFVNEYGFLGTLSGGADAKSESLAYIKSQQSGLQLFYHFNRTASIDDMISEFNVWVPSQFSFRLVRVDDQAEVQLVPPSLISWMWLTLAEEIKCGVRWDYCRNCDKPMALGGGHYRIDAAFCSDSCRAIYSRNRPRQKEKLSHESRRRKAKKK